MTFQEKITRAFAQKNWQVEEYDYDRNDGYAIMVNTEEYPEVNQLGDPAPAMLNDAQEDLIAAYSRAFDDVEAQIMTRGNSLTCDGGCILSNTKTGALEVAALIPDRLTLTTD